MPYLKYKHYVCLYDSDKGTITFPIKAEKNPYDGSVAYCAYMPQFFGGKGYFSKTGKKLSEEALIRDTDYYLKKEVQEESRLTIRLTRTNNIIKIQESDIENNTSHYTFYCADQNDFSYTGTDWIENTTNKALLEMRAVITINLEDFSDKTEDEIIEILLSITKPGQLYTEESYEKGLKDFNESETIKAFKKLIPKLISISKEEDSKEDL